MLDVADRYGAVADNATDNHAAFANAISDSQTSGGDIVYVPAATGHYLVSQPVRVPNGVPLKGVSPRASIIGATPDFTGPAVVMNADNSGGQEFFWVEDLQVHGSGVAPVGILLDRLFVNSGVQRVITTYCTQYGIQVASSTGGGPGPLYFRDIWALHAGRDCFHVQDGQRQIWIDNLTCEYPGAGFAACRMVGSGGMSFGHRINGLHMENYSNGVATGLVLDGIVNSEVSSVSVTGKTADGGPSWDDVVQIKNGASQVSVRTVTGASANCVNLIHDTVNGVTIPAGASGDATRMPEYKTWTRRY